MSETNEIKHWYSGAWEHLMPAVKQLHEALFILLEHGPLAELSDEVEELRIEDLAHKYHELAAAKAPGITKDMLEISAATGSRLEHLATSVKEEDSMQRKIRLLVDVKDVTPDEAVEEFSDCVRFTDVSDNEHFTEHFFDFREELLKKSYVIVRVSNTITDTTKPYRGVNCYVQDPEGYWFELQFHTDESYASLRKTHKMYREWRDVNTPPERKAEIEEEMRAIASTVPVPRGAGDIVPYLLKK